MMLIAISWERSGAGRFSEVVFGKLELYTFVTLEMEKCDVF